MLKESGDYSLSICAFALTSHPFIVDTSHSIFMHELSIALSMIEMATEESNKRGGAKIDALHLKLGALSGVVKDALLFSWEIACQGTPLENSRLEIEEIPVTAHCANCHADRKIEVINNLICPVCSTPTNEILQGRDLEVTALEIIEN